MWKALGALLVLLAACYACFLLTHWRKRREQQLEGVLQLLHRIRHDVSCFARPLGEIVAAFEHPALRECGFLPAEGLSVDLATMLQSTKGRWALSGEEMQVLRSFVCSVGKGYREEQLALCDRTIADMEMAYREHRKELPRVLKAERALILLSALSAILLLS